MGLCRCEINGHHYILELASAQFEWEYTRGTRGERVLFFSWRRETQFKNIIYLRLITLRLCRPFFTHQVAVLDRNEPFEGEEND